MSGNGKTRELFTQFVLLRQNNYSREAAWQKIEAAAAQLPTPEREQLVLMLRNWEAAEGHQHKSQNDPFETLNKPPERLAKKRNVIKRLKPAEPEPPDSIACPTCQKPNPKGSVHCYSCGTMLAAIPPAPDGTQPLAPNTTDNAYFGKDWLLYLKIQGTDQTIRLQPRLTEMILGRKSPDSVMLPDVDLTAYGGGDKGVSRLHASFKRQDETLVLTDLGSVNHTFINGQRVHAHEVRVVHDGDEIRLGRLVLYAYFRES
jgi:hypothetical protein